MITTVISINNNNHNTFIRFIQFGSSTGSASYMYDEEVPQAYEQVSDGKQTMANKVGDFMDNNHVCTHLLH